MGELIRLSDRIYPWKEVFKVETELTTLQVYMNTGTGELEVVQMNDEGEAIRTCLSTVDSVSLSMAVSRAHQKIGKQ